MQYTHVGQYCAVMVTSLTRLPLCASVIALTLIRKLLERIAIPIKKVQASLDYVVCSPALTDPLPVYQVKGRQ